MSRGEGLFRSGLAVRCLIALSQGGRIGLSLRELSRCLRVRDSSVQSALRPLRGAGLLLAERSRYRLAPQRALAELLVVALNHVAREEALRILVCANPAVEYASLIQSRAGLEVIVIERDEGDPVSVAQLRSALGAFRGEPAVRATRELHDPFVYELRYPFSEAQRTRRRALRGLVLNGSAARSLPDRSRTRRSKRSARPLYRPHPSLRLPRPTALRRVARVFGVKRMALFGSAVRADFRPDSDVDVLVRYRADTRRSLFEDVRLENALEALFDRDVDVVVESDLSDGTRSRAAREAVPIHA